MSFITFLIGMGSFLLIALPLSRWLSNKYATPYTESIYSPKKKSDIKEQEKKQNVEYQYDISANPVDKQPGLSFDAKMNLFIPICLLSIMPLGIGAIVFFGMNLEKFGFSDNVFGLIILGCLCIPLLLSITFYTVAGHYFEKRLPRYSAMGRITGKKFVSVRTGKHGHTTYCVLRIFLETNGAGIDFFTPQKIYEHVKKGDLVKIVYHQLSAKRLVIDVLDCNELSPSGTPLS